MIIEIVATFVTVCLTISEWLANPKKILEKLHIAYNGELSEKSTRESEDQNEELDELPLWDFENDD